MKTSAALLNLLRHIVPVGGLLMFFFAAGCATDPSLRDPSGPDVAEISGSPASGPTGVPISISGIDEEPRVIGPGPSWKRRVSPGNHRVTVCVVRGLLNGQTEFGFEALPGHRYEIRARDGGGFYFLDLVDVTDPAAPKKVVYGRFAASGSVLVASPFVPLPIDGKE
jgi:hypothetical protein